MSAKRSPAVAAGALEVDAELLHSLAQRVQQIAAQAGAAARIDALELLRWPGVMRDATRDHTPMIAAAHALLSAQACAGRITRVATEARLAEGAGRAAHGLDRARDAAWPSDRSFFACTPGSNR